MSNPHFHEKTLFHLESSEVCFERICYYYCTTTSTGDGGDDDGDDGGRIFPEHPTPILHAPRDNISRKDSPSLRQNQNMFFAGISKNVKTSTHLKTELSWKTFRIWLLQNMAGSKIWLVHNMAGSKYGWFKIWAHGPYGPIGPIGVLARAHRAL